MTTPDALREAVAIRTSSEITNELGNRIAFELYSQGSEYPSHADLSHPIVSVKAKGPTTSISHQWTLAEARELHRLLSLAFPLALTTTPLAREAGPIEEIAKLIWHRFGDGSQLEWEDANRAEYLLAADAIRDLISARGEA